MKCGEQRPPAKKSETTEEEKPKTPLKRNPSLIREKLIRNPG